MKKMKGMKGYECCGSKIWLMKLSLVAGVLFVLNIWPAAMNWVINVHWGWLLGAAILFCLIAMKHTWLHGKKKRK